ncbi:MAG: hypothetical protein PVSMB4_15840 [Ktedonobacterales bacterium]
MIGTERDILDLANLGAATQVYNRPADQRREPHPAPLLAHPVGLLTGLWLVGGRALRHGCRWILPRLAKWLPRLAKWLPRLANLPGLRRRVRLGRLNGRVLLPWLASCVGLPRLNGLVGRVLLPRLSRLNGRVLLPWLNG